MTETSPLGERVAAAEARLIGHDRELEELKQDVKDILESVRKLERLAATGHGGLIMFVRMGMLIAAVSAIGYELHGFLFPK